MKTFLSLPPHKRSQFITRLVRVFATNANVLNANISILSYGSASYGFNHKNHGKIDDIDLFIVIPRVTNTHEFLDCMEKVFLSRIQINKDHLVDVISGQSDICRMYGIVNGVKVGFRIICADTFEKVSSEKGSRSVIRNIASIGQSRIVVDKEWSFKLGRYVRITYQHRYVNLNNEDVLLVEHSVFSKHGCRLGALGRKILTMTPVYDPTGSCASVLRKIWTLFVKRSQRYKPGIKSAEIIGSITRSERFSPKFKTRLHELIAELR